MAVDMLADGLLIKVGVFVLVQALVYLILSGSSNVFSEKKKMERGMNSFRPARSVSIRRMLALLSDMPPEADPPTPPAALHEARQEDQK